MGWLAFAILLVLSVCIGWQAWRRWVEPWSDLELIVRQIARNKTPGTFIVGGSRRVRALGGALEQIAQQQAELRTRVQAGEFGVQAIVSALEDGIVVADRQRRVRLMNGAFRQFFELDGVETGRTLLETVRDATIEGLLGDALANGQSQGGAIVLPKPNGDLHLEVLAEPIRSEGGGIAGAVIVFRDATERRRTEALRRDFVANVSHELRTPVSILRGYLETLLENPKQPPAELLRIFEVMERHSNRLNLLLDDVLSLARLESPGVTLDLGPVRVNQFLREILRDWEKNFASKELKVELDVPADLPPIQADEARLQEVMYNLLDNAVKYSSRKGRVAVQVTLDRDMLEISVSDTGSGIAAPDLPRIFERFYRADKARQQPGGTGLGLSIVKHITQLHGGTVDAKSELGHGTTVTVRFPLATGS